MSDLREQQIQERAYEIYLKRGCKDGFALEDWLVAEEELRDEQVAEPVAHTKTRIMTASRESD